MEGQAQEADRMPEPGKAGGGVWQELGNWGGHLTVIEHLIAGAQLVPAQLPSIVCDWSAEKQLAAAVFASAMMDIRHRRPDGRDRRVVDKALAWVYSRDAEWPFSFLRLCDLFDLNPTWVREQVQRWINRPAAGGRGTPYSNAA